jgi:hypothetical protein
VKLQDRIAATELSIVAGDLIAGGEVAAIKNDKS